MCRFVAVSGLERVSVSTISVSIDRTFSTTGWCAAILRTTDGRDGVVSRNVRYEFEAFRFNGPMSLVTIYRPTNGPRNDGTLCVCVVVALE